MAPSVRKVQTNCRKREIAKRKVRLFAMYIMWQMNEIHRDYWVHPLNTEQGGKGEFYMHYADHHKFPERFFQLYRMSV